MRWRLSHRADPERSHEGLIRDALAVLKENEQ